MNRSILAFASAAFFLYHAGPLAAAPDRYANVSELRADRVEGRDFRVEALDRGSAVTVLAIHGGDIETGTSELARSLAGDEWNLYLFEGLRGEEGSAALHVTAAHFDDPSALRLAVSAELAVAFHGKKHGAEEICLGGANAPLRQAAGRALARAGFDVQEPCLRLPGTSPENIVNRSSRGGLQLEISRELRDRFAEDPELQRRLIAAVRESVEASLGRSPDIVRGAAP